VGHLVAAAGITRASPIADLLIGLFLIALGSVLGFDVKGIRRHSTVKLLARSVGHRNVTTIHGVDLIHSSWEDGASWVLV